MAHLPSSSVPPPEQLYTRAGLEHLRLERQLLLLEKDFLSRSRAIVPASVSQKVSTARANEGSTERLLLARYVESLKELQRSKASTKPAASATAAGKRGTGKAAAATSAPSSGKSTQPSRLSKQPGEPAGKKAQAVPPPTVSHAEALTRIEAEVEEHIQRSLQRREELEKLLCSLKQIVRSILDKV